MPWQRSRQRIRRTKNRTKSKWKEHYIFGGLFILILVVAYLGSFYGVWQKLDELKTKANSNTGIKIVPYPTSKP